MAKTTPLGGEWLKEKYKLHRYNLTHCSFLGNNPDISLTSAGNIEQVYGPSYATPDDPMKHLEFYLKYDDFNLDFIEAVFRQLDHHTILHFIEEHPASIYSRKIGFLYEFTIGKTLQLKSAVGGNYRDLLDEKHYITGKTVKNTRWRINDNLLGTAAFCPVIRKKKELEELLQSDVTSKLENLQKTYPLDIFHRATQFLYKKETQSSFEIERETPTQQRMERFIELLRKAGSEPVNTMLTEPRLLILQQAIVDPRFAATRFRDFQNFVGQTLPNGQQLFHYVCPTPEMVSSLMEGLQQTAIKTAGTPAAVRAAVLSFGFVFIHPFDDGNGRIHRFLIHDVLHQDKLVPDALVIPISAHMLAHIRDYDKTLEKYSTPLMQRIRFDQNVDQSITVTNTAEVAGYYKFPDLTEQAIYLLKTLHGTLDEDMPGELLFLLRYDELKKAIQEIVDMPDRMLNQLIIFIHQNKGTLAKRKRQMFEMLTDEEILAMQEAYQQTFQSS